MQYFDTSFLVPLVIPEAISDSIQGFFDQLPPDELLSFSHWGKLEMASVTARLVRMRELTEQQGEACLQQFLSLVDASFVVHRPSLEDYQTATAFVARFDTGLRAGDALHLAIAVRYGATAIHTLDQGMARAGEVLNLPVQMLNT